MEHLTGKSGPRLCGCKIDPFDRGSTFRGSDPVPVPAVARIGLLYEVCVFKCLPRSTDRLLNRTLLAIVVATKSKQLIDSPVPSYPRCPHGVVGTSAINRNRT